MKVVKLYSLILSLLTSFSIIAQSNSFMDNWHFGWFASVNFSSGAPVATSGSTMISTEGCATYSDNQGNLLFYTDGGKNNPGPTAPGGVRNANHQMMPNGDMNNGEGGCDSSPQSALIIPKSGSEYYLFTIGCNNQPLGLKKSIIDMSLDGGLGDVTIKGDQIPGVSSNLAEGMTATKHANGIDHWLIVHSSGGNTYFVFLVTSTVIMGPTAYSVGSGDNLGQIKISVQGDKIAFNSEVLDFDNSTGAISNPISIGTESFWGRAFSASGDYLYMRTIMGDLYQYDMNATDIAASEVLISSVLSATGNLQLGPDLKIYGSSNGNNYLSAITNPELPGQACNYLKDFLLLSGSAQCQMGLPNFIDSELKNLLNTSEIESTEFPIKFYPNPATNKIIFAAKVNKRDLRIFTADGKELNNWELIGQELDLTSFQSGMYIMTYFGSNEFFIKE